jgi:nucleoside-diphosphate-sugar epimerase
MRMKEQIEKDAPVLVTGATGFIGQGLVERLLKEGLKVRAYVRNPSKVSDGDKKGIELFRGDFSDLIRLEEATIGTGLIYHLGELPTAGSKTRRHNVEIVQRLISRAAHHPRQRLIFVSSLSVAGIPSITPATEDTQSLHELSDPYTEYKRRAEKVIRAAAIEDRLDYVIVRPALVYGPGSRHLKGLLAWLERYGNIGVPLVGGGDNIAPLIHVDDLVNLLARVGHDPKASAKIINAVDDSRVTLRELLMRIGQLMGKVVRIRPVPKTLVSLLAIPIDALGSMLGLPFGIGGLVEMMSHDVVFSNIRMKARMDGPLAYPTITEGLSTLIDWYQRQKQEGR